MDTIHTNQEKYHPEKARVAAIKGFQVHFIVFAAVIVGLFAINYLGGKSWWVQWPFFGWGLGILGHAYLVYCSKAQR